MSSILTNVAAMAALQSLTATNKALADTQNRISTGQRVSSAKDDAAMWAVATTMNGDISSFKAVSDNLSLADSTVSVARKASEQVTSLLTSMKEKIVSAQNSSVDRSKIQADLDQLVSQIQSVVGTAQFNGVNYVNASSSVNVLASLDRGASGVTAGNITFTTHDLNTTSGGGLADIAGIDVTSDSGAAAALSTIETAITTAEGAAADFGTAQNRIESQQDFMSSLIDTMTEGVGSIVDADMEEEAARLTALQTQQQLGLQALSIANSAPQSVLSLFRG